MANMKLSHIGVIVKDIQEFSHIMEDIFQAKPVGEMVEDPEQKAFLKMYKSGESFVELISPASENSSVQTALRRMGEGLAHLCFETDNLEEALSIARSKGALIFTRPTPAVLFNNRRVAFAILPNRMIVEFLEAG